MVIAADPTALYEFRADPLDVGVECTHELDECLVVDRHECPVDAVHHHRGHPQYWASSPTGEEVMDEHTKRLQSLLDHQNADLHEVAKERDMLRHLLYRWAGWRLGQCDSGDLSPAEQALVKYINGGE